MKTRLQEKERKRVLKIIFILAIIILILVMVTEYNEHLIDKISTHNFSDLRKNQENIFLSNIPKNNWTCPQCDTKNPYWNTCCSECGMINW